MHAVEDMATENRAVETLLTGPQFDFLVIAAQVLLWGMHRGTVDSHLGVWMLSRIFTMRAQNEEAVMAARFGKEWANLLKTPIPPGRPSSSFPYLASQFEIPPRGIPVYKSFASTPISQYSLQNTATTIRTLLLEWIAGLDSHPSIQELNRDLGTLWRFRGERNLYNSRATIVREFKRLVMEREMAEEAIVSLQTALGKNAFLTLSKRIGQENKALGRAGCRPVVREKSTSMMRDTPEEPHDEDEFVVVDDEKENVLNGWRGVKEEEEEEEERHISVGRPRDVREGRDERSKSKKRQLGSPQVKKVKFDSRVKVEKNHDRVKLEDEDSP
ncbi:MAG: hypothetical protein BYD32DRAFT_487322 [Podila humilis]|nr:MAG: hypothetical protein BYD32DRAFT_487322 [Podila humilis]